MNLFGNLEKYSNLADKYAVREYVARKLGDEYLKELFGVFDDEKDIDFSQLPQKFVIKATHGCNWNILCENKDKLDADAARKLLGQWLKSNYYKVEREIIYKNIPPRLICEFYLEDKNNGALFEYNLFCFNGIVKYIIVDLDRSSENTSYFFDRNWVNWPLKGNSVPSEIIEKPFNLEKMITAAETLAEGIPFTRIDLFNVNKKIIFGEMTFTPNAGFAKNRPDGWDFELGTHFDLPVNP